MGKAERFLGTMITRLNGRLGITIRFLNQEDFKKYLNRTDRKMSVHSAEAWSYELPKSCYIVVLKYEEQQMNDKSVLIVQGLNSSPANETLENRRLDIIVSVESGVITHYFTSKEEADAAKDILQEFISAPE